MSNNVVHRGKITDQQGNPLIGAHITLADNPFPKGTISDFSGNFRIDGFAGEQYNIGHIGKHSVKITLKKGMSDAAYRLLDSAVPLDEVVVTAPKKNNGYLGILAFAGLAIFASKKLFNS